MEGNRPPTGRRLAFREPGSSQRAGSDAAPNPLFDRQQAESEREGSPLLNHGGVTPARAQTGAAGGARAATMRRRGDTVLPESDSAFTLRSQFGGHRMGETGGSLPDENWLYSEMKGEADNLADYVKDLLERRGDGDPRVAALVAQKRRLQQQLRDHEDQIKKLQGLLGEKAKEVEEGKKALDSALDEKQSLQRQLDMMEQMVEGNRNLRQILQQLDDLKRENKSLKAKIADLTDEKAELKDFTKELEDKLEDAEYQLEDLEGQVLYLKSEVQRLQDIIDEPEPWWRASRCLCLLLLLLLLLALGLALALALVMLLPGSGDRGVAEYDGPDFLQEPSVLSATGDTINFQVQTNADARVYYCLVQNRNTGSSVQPAGEQVAATSVPYSTTGVPGALACGAASTVDSQLKTVSIRDRKSKGLAECVGRVSDCLRCPAVSSETSYRLYLAVGYPEANWELQGVSESSVLSVTTADVTPPSWSVQPQVEPRGQNDFSLTVAMNEEGTVDYVVYYGDWDVDFHGTPLEHALQAPTCSADLSSADPNALRGSVAASGAFDVPSVGSDFTVGVSPRCPEPLPGALEPGAPEPCSLAFQGLTPNSPYQVCLVAQDLEGNRQQSPTCVPLQTGLDDTPPQINVTSANATRNSFDLLISMDERGTASVLVIEPIYTVVPFPPPPPPPPGPEAAVPTSTPTGTPAARRMLLQVASSPSPTSAATPVSTPSPSGPDPTALPTSTPEQTAEGSPAPAGGSPVQPTPTATPTSTPLPDPLGTPTSTPAPTAATLETPAPTAAAVETPAPTAAQSPPPPPPPPPPAPLRTLQPDVPLCATVIYADLDLSPEIIILGDFPANASAAALPVAEGAGSVPVEFIDQPVRFTVTGLRPDTMYRAYVAGQDDALPTPNNTPEPVALDVFTLDTIPPVFVNESPKLGPVYSTNFTVIAALSEPGLVHYVVLPRDAPEPMPEQILTGVDGDESPAAAASRFPAPAQCGDTYGVVDGRGVDPDTAYDVWLVGTDETGNLMLRASVLAVETVDDVPPTLSNVTSYPSCGGAQTNLTADEEGTLAYVLTDCREALKGSVTGDEVFSGIAGNGTVMANGTATLQPDSVLTLDFAGLEDSSKYLLFLAAEDIEAPPNRMAVPYKGGVVVETDDCLPPAIAASAVLSSTQPGLPSYTAVLSVQLDEPAVLAVQVVDASSWGYVPTPEDVLSEPPCTGPPGAVIFTSNQLVESTQLCDPRLVCGCGRAPPETQIVVPGLRGEKAYTFYIAALDLAGNPASMAAVDVRTPDTSPPTWMWGTPVVQCLGDYSAVVLVQLDEDSELSFAVTEAGEAAPGINDLFRSSLAASSFVTGGSLQVSGRPRNATVIDPVVRAQPDSLGQGFQNVSEYSIEAPGLPVLTPEDCKRIRAASDYWSNRTSFLTPPPPAPPAPPQPREPPVPPVSTTSSPSSDPTQTPVPSTPPPSPRARRLLQDLGTSAPTPQPTPQPTAAATPSGTFGNATSAPEQPDTPPPPPFAPPPPPSPPPAPLYPGVALPNCREGPSDNVAVRIQSGDVMAYALYLEGLQPLTDYQVSLGARDLLEPPNAQTAPTVLSFTTTDREPPEVVFFDVQGSPPSSVALELGLNEPGTAFFTFQPVTAPPPTPEQVFDPTLIPRDDLVASGNVTIDFGFPFTATAGFCGALCNSEYAIYLVAQDKQDPPNRQDEFRREVFFFDCDSSPKAVVYSNASETCTNDFLVGRARAMLFLTEASPGFPTGPTVSRLGSVQRTFRDFRDMPPGSDVAVQVSLDPDGEVLLEADMNVGASLLQHSAVTTGKLGLKVRAVSRTPGVWTDARTLKVQYQLFDILGRSQVQLEDLTVTATVEEVPAANNVFPCALPSATTGVGLCSVTVPDGFLFTSTSAPVTIRASYARDTRPVTAVADPVRVQLWSAPTYSSMTAAGVFLGFPVRAVLPGSTFSVPVYAFSPDKCVNEFLLPFAFDPAALRLAQGSENSALYSPGLLLEDKLGEGFFSLSVQSARSPSTCSRRRGQSVLLATLQFSVISTEAPPAILRNVLSCGDASQSSNYVRLSEDGNPTPFNTNNPLGRVAQINDRQGGRVLEAELELYERQMNGLISYLDTSELFATTVFTGDPVGARATTLVIYNDDTQETVTPFCGLDEGGAAVATVTSGSSAGCTITVVPAAPLSFPASTHLVVNYERFSLPVKFRVWHPMSATVTAEDPMLHRLIPRAEIPAGCRVGDTWQETRVSAVAEFDTFGLPGRSLDISNLVTFSSSNPAVAQVQGNAVVGVGINPGSAEITVELRAPDPQLTLTPVPVELVDDTACVVSLRTLVVTGGTLGAPRGSNETLPAELDVGLGSMAVEMAAEQLLDAESSEGHVRVYASFSDGSVMDVTSSPGLLLESADPSIVEVVSSGRDPRVRVTAQVGRAAVCGELLFATWSACGLELGAGTAPVYVSLPTPVSIALGSGQQEVTCSGDAAEFLGIPTAAQLSVQVGFDKGRLQDYTTDDRVAFNVTSVPPLCEVVKAPGQQAYVRAIPSGASCSGVCTVEASFGGLVSEVQVALVGLQDVTACLKPWYSSGAMQGAEMEELLEENDAGGACGEPSELRRFSCAPASGPEFEQAAVVGIARLTSGALFDVTSNSRTAFVSSDSGIATVERSASSAQLLNRVFPRAPGAAAVAVNFAGVPSGGAEVSVLDEVSYVAEVSTSAAWCSGSNRAPCSTTFCPSTFRGTRGTQRQISITAVMSSGLRYPSLDRYLSLEPGVFPVTTILEFGSDKSEEVDVSASGLATLRGNAACGAASLRTAARAQCAAPGASAEDVMDVYGNLDPVELDVDFGQEVGPPVHPSAPCSAAVQVGDSLLMPVRINSRGAPLLSFNLRVTYDDSLLAVEGCNREVADKHRWSCNYQLTAGEVRIVVFNEDGINGAAEFQGSAVLLATVVFRAVGSGDTTFEGSIIEAAQAGLSGRSLVNTPMDAGAVSTCINDEGGAVRRRLLELPGASSVSAAPWLDPGVQHRQLLQGGARVDCSSCTLEKHLSLLGDVNFDCKVDLQYDLSFLSIAGGLANSESREEYYSRLQSYLCVPGQCSELQVPSCYLDHGAAMTEHQKLQLDLFHILPAPDGATEVEDCGSFEAIDSFRRSGFDDSVIPQCTWKEIDALLGPIDGVNVVLINDVQPVTSNSRQFFAEVAAKSTLLLGGFSSGELEATALNVSVALVNYLPEVFATAALTEQEASSLAVYLDLRQEFTGTLRFESPATGEELPAVASADGSGQLVQLSFDASTSEFAAMLRPNNRVAFKGDLVQVGLVVSQLSTSDEWISVQPWYGSPEYVAWRSRSGLAARGDFTEAFMPYTTLEVGSGVLPCDCSFPTAAAIRDRGLDLKLCLTGPARVRYVIMQEPLPPGVLPPTLAQVHALEGPSGGPEPLAAGAFDYEPPEGTAGQLVMFPFVHTVSNGDVQMPTVSSIKLQPVPPTGSRYMLYSVLTKSTAQGRSIWPSMDQAYAAPYSFEPGQPAVPLPAVEMQATAALVGQAFVNFMVQDDSLPPPTPDQILAQKDSEDQDAVFSGNFPFSLPLFPSAFSLSGNVTISGGVGTPLFETIEGLPDREGFSVYLALDGRGMLQATGIPTVLSNVTVPDTQAPTFLSLEITKDLSQLDDGFLNLQVDLEMDEAANVTYAVYKQFDCTDEPELADVLLGGPAPMDCARNGLSDSVAHGSFEVGGGGPETVRIDGIRLSPFSLMDSTCLPGTLDKVSTTFYLYLVAYDIGDVLACLASYCGESDPGVVTEDGCDSTSPRECSQPSASATGDECPCPAEPEGLLSSGGSAWSMPPDACHNNLQGMSASDAAPLSSPWTLWKAGVPQGSNGSPLEAPPDAQPAKVLIDLSPDAGEAPTIDVIEQQIQEFEDRLVIPFLLSSSGRVTYMLTNITLPTEVEEIVGPTGQPAIQGYQVANGNEGVPKEGSTSLRGEMDIVSCPGLGEILPASPYYLFFFSTDPYFLVRSDELGQLNNLRTARSSPSAGQSTATPAP